MKFLKYLILGIIFGIALSKSEAVSWFRIYEMFRFQSFHMYGIIGSAVGVGLLIKWLIARYKVKSFSGQTISTVAKQKSIIRYLVGGTIFGLGWALTGACPGPLFVLIGSGATVVMVVVLSAILGTYVYGLLRHKLPH